METEVRIRTRDASLSGNLTVPRAASCFLFTAAAAAGIARATNLSLARSTGPDWPRCSSISSRVRRRQWMWAPPICVLTSACSLIGSARQRIGSCSNPPYGIWRLVTSVRAPAAGQHSSRRQSAAIGLARWSRGGRPDLAGAALPNVKAPTLLIVGGLDDVVIDLNRAAMAQMRCTVELEIVPGATHLFEEPGALETVATLADKWFTRQRSKPSSDNKQPVVLRQE